MSQTTFRATGPANKMKSRNTTKHKKNRFDNIKISFPDKITTVEEELNTILNPIEEFLVSQPTCFRQKMKMIAISLLDCADTRLSKQKTLDRFSSNTDYIPSSARFKFKLTCSKELSDDPRYKALADDCDTGIKTVQKLLTSRMHDLLNLEIIFAKENHLTNFISDFHIFAQGLTIRHLERNKHLNINTSIFDISLIALKTYMHDDISNLTSYFDVNKHNIFRHCFKITVSPSYTKNNTNNNKNSTKETNQRAFDNQKNDVVPLNNYTKNNKNNPYIIKNIDAIETSINQNPPPSPKNQNPPPSPKNLNQNLNQDTLRNKVTSNEAENENTSNYSDEKFIYDLSVHSESHESIHSDNNLPTPNNTDDIEPCVPPTQQHLTTSDDSDHSSDHSFDTTQSTPTKYSKKLFTFSTPPTPRKTNDDDRNPFEQILSDINREKRRKEKKQKEKMHNTKKRSDQNIKNTNNNNTSTHDTKTKHTNHTTTISSSTTPKLQRNPPTSKLITPKLTTQKTPTNKPNTSSSPSPSSKSDSTMFTNNKSKKSNSTTLTLDNLPKIPRKQGIKKRPIDIDDSDVSTISHDSTDKPPPQKTKYDDKTSTIFEIKNQLNKIIPHLSYKLFNFHNSENEESQADAAVMAFWEANSTTKITTEVNLSLEQEKNLKKETISNLITTTCRNVIQKTKTNDHLNKSSHNNLNTSSHLKRRTTFITQPTHQKKKLKWTPPSHTNNPSTVSSIQHNTYQKIKQHNKRMQRFAANLYKKGNATHNKQYP